MSPPVLTVRNLTAGPLDLVHVERFAAEKVARGSTMGNMRGVITSLFNATDFRTRELRPKGDPVSTGPAPHRIDAFQTRETDVPAPQPATEVVRLTFAAAGRRYETDIPSPVGWSETMRRLGRDADDDGRREKLTPVYFPRAGFLAVFSSTHLASWMADLPDDLPLSVLSIPGTHNSPSCYVALPAVRCQVAGVLEQLDNGVRFLDVRVSAESGTDAMPLVHSAFPVSLAATKYFSVLVGRCYAFLDANPSECIVMSVKREGTGRAGDERMGRYLRDRHVAADRQRWFTANRVPRLGEARGRIVLVRRFRLDPHVAAGEDGGEFGVDAEAWPDNCADGSVAGGRVRVQDFYEIEQGARIERKIRYTTEHLERAAALSHGSAAVTAGCGEGGGEKEAPPLFVNFLSASNFFVATCWPERVAARVNPAILEYLCMTHGVAGKGEKGLTVGDGGTGIVVTDWVGAHGNWDLVRCVVGMNSRFIVKRSV